MNDTQHLHKTLPTIQWRPVSDPPKEADDYLVYCSGEIAIGWFSGGSWSRIDGEGISPTHWAELPAPPHTDAASDAHDGPSGTDASMEASS